MRNGNLSNGICKISHISHNCFKKISISHEFRIVIYRADKEP